MIDPLAGDLTDEIQAAVTRSSRSLLRRLLKKPIAVASLSFLLFIVLIAVFGPYLAPHDPNTASAADVLGPLSATHPLGTDSAGRDVLSRLLFATRFSIAGAALALIVAALIGVTGGLIAGYYGRWFEGLSSWVVGILQALPGIVVLLAARAVLGPSLWTSMAIFGVLLSPAFYRLVYSTVTAVRDELYVDAARVSGLTDGRIISRHILTVVRGPALVQASFVAGVAIAIQAGLDFLGLGDLSIPTWGSMLNEGFSNIYTDPVLMLWPSLAIGLTCVSLVLLANALRDTLEQSGRKRRRTRRDEPASIPAIEREPIVSHAGDHRFDGAEVLLAVDRLAVGYGQDDGSITTVVEDVSLTVRRGEVHGLIGESGSGKTQTAWSVLRLLPDGGRIVGGSITFEGQDLAGKTEAQMRALRGLKIAYIPQEPMSNLDASFTVGSQLVEPMRVKLKLSRPAAKARALELLRRVGIPNPERTFNAYPHEISGGMAQRVLIAGAVSCDPDLLIADEPTTALDVTVQADVLDLLRRLQSELNMGMILVTHNFGVVADLCDTVSVMRSGRIVETGPVLELFARPQHPYTRSLFDAVLDESEGAGSVAADIETADTNGALR
ncbi:MULTISPECIES: dipeptide/oligopeptide/nickel ABC transporter permease/ATP-binding protein [unclassified Leifsonia]|uniref:dipeptide/oligopeptide/nickel ABC transporter permease/ATP-binding protein n=1 Tax=unclassified Leifsonia TaxID=2663824 RepID=UPI0008A7C3B7|nr:MULTISPECIES: dipeptide/oligopeptide/nickel ABC transporter permease/ATP-binding protein [unclassified Leifsonia]SEH66519.1 Oligopeptide/dipeptide transporter, C-terminal region [Leifsonia sp. CL154]SFL28255.1 Oligopeptide/dipeptide transporter, C-terminal region [Leifsonia sp. CL147]